MNTKQTILGISPGTRTIGIAILEAGRLVEAKIKSFQGKWTDTKRKGIIDMINELIKEYEITSIALKTIHAARSSPELNQVIFDIKELAEKEQTNIGMYTIKDIEKHCSSESQKNKSVIPEFVAGLFPELQAERNKERTNRTKYYIKMFEAVACALIVLS